MSFSLRILFACIVYLIRSVYDLSTEFVISRAFLYPQENVDPATIEKIQYRQQGGQKPCAVREKRI